MPIYEYKCPDCGEVYEAVMIGTSASPLCPFCGGRSGERIISATSGLSGKTPQSTPGPRDHGCCGSNPHQKGCTPGSCCGKA